MASSWTQLVDLEPTVKIKAVINQPRTLSKPTEKPTVVFLHFWGGSTRTWSLVIPHVSATYPTIALDFRGWGDSIGPNDKDAYSSTALAKDVEATIAALELRSVVLVGLSMGAKVAQLVASRICAGAAQVNGDMALLGVILISPAPTTPLILPPEMREQQLHAYDNPEPATFVAKNVLTASFQSRDLPHFVVPDMLRGSKLAREAWPAYAMAEDVSSEVDRIRVPVLVLAAEKDLVEPVERIKTEVCGRISGAELEVLPGSGHLSPLDAPEEVAESIVRFLEPLEGL